MLKLFTYQEIWLTSTPKISLMVHVEFVCPICGHECPMLVYACYSSIHAMLSTMMNTLDLYRCQMLLLIYNVHFFIITPDTVERSLAEQVDTD